MRRLMSAILFKAETKTRIVFSIFFFFVSFVSFSQNVKLSGYIVSEDSRDRISNANIIDVYSGKGTASNDFGYYELDFKYGDSVLISVTHVSYSENIFDLKMTKNLHYDVVMKQGHFLPEVSVEERTPIENRLELANMRITGKQLKLIPSVAGEADIMRAFQLMPGVSNANEGRAGISVRGGDFGHNLYVYDGTPLFSVNHAGGFLSTFDSDIIEKADLVKGGFSANYGGRLSSIMDIETRNIEDMMRGNLSIGLLNCKLSLGGPLKNNKTSVLFSVRRFMFDLIMYPASSVFLDDQQVGFTFYDLNFKINHRFNDKNSLSFGVYVGDDIYKIGNELYGQLNKSRFRISSGNKMASLKWKHKFNERTDSKINLSITDYHSTALAKFTDVTDRNFVYTTKFTNAVNIMDLRLAGDINYKLWGKSVLRAGFAESVYYSFPYNIKHTNTVNDSIVYQRHDKSVTLYSNEISVYALGELHFGKYVSSNLGFRMTHYYDFEGKKSYFQPEPRALLMIHIPKVFTVKASYSHVYQNIQSVTAMISGIPAERWLMSTGKLSPAKSEQFDVGIARSFLDGMYELSVDAYYKKMSGLAMLTQKISIDGMAENITDMDLLSVGGNGKAKGIEVLFSKTRGSLTGFIGYSLSKNLRQFEEINNNEYFYADNDCTHTFSLSGNWRISDKFSLSVSWAFASGAPISVPTGMFYTENGTYSYIYEGVNNYRMKSYHRLDVGFNFMKSLRWGERTLTVGIINLYNRRNPYFYYIGNEEMWQYSIFPFMPTINYSVNFNKISLLERGKPYLESQKEFSKIFRRHSLGFQFNPYLGDMNNYKPIVFAARYSFGIFDYLSVGVEFSGYKATTNLTSEVDTRYGVLCRAKYPYLKYLHPFVEISAYYGRLSETYSLSTNKNSITNYFSGYAAPGISINLIKKYFSIDFMYKFSPRKIIDAKFRVISWRLNVNF